MCVCRCEVPEKLVNRLKAEAAAAVAKGTATAVTADIWEYRIPLQLLLRMLPKLGLEVSADRVKFSILQSQ